MFPPVMLQGSAFDPQPLMDYHDLPLYANIWDSNEREKR
jgi:hypothetical protein